LDGDSVTVEEAKITNLEDVASYNWIKDAKPIIMIPGNAAPNVASPDKTRIY
jgi:hypothetical protein